MIEKDPEGSPEEGDATNVTSDEMSQALHDMKASSPALAGAIDAANVTPEGLAGSHDRATGDEHDAAHPATSDG